MKTWRDLWLLSGYVAYTADAPELGGDPALKAAAEALEANIYPPDRPVTDDEYDRFLAPFAEVFEFDRDDENDFLRVINPDATPGWFVCGVDETSLLFFDLTARVVYLDESSGWVAGGADAGDEVYPISDPAVGSVRWA